MGPITFEKVPRDAMSDVYSSLCALETECFPGTSACRDNFLDLAKDRIFSVSVATQDETVVGACYGKYDTDVWVQPTLFQDKGKLVGGKPIRAMDDRHYRMMYVDRPNVHIKFVAVTSRLRGRSVALRLLSKFLEDREEPSVSLHVRADNHRAVDLYKLAGFDERAWKIDNGKQLFLTGYTRSCRNGLAAVISEFDELMRVSKETKNTRVLAGGNPAGALMSDPYRRDRLRSVAFAAKLGLSRTPR